MNTWTKIFTLGIIGVSSAIISGGLPTNTLTFKQELGLTISILCIFGLGYCLKETIDNVYYDLAEEKS